MEGLEIQPIGLHRKVFCEACSLSYIDYPLYEACIYGLNKVLVENNLDRISSRTKNRNDIYIAFEVLESSIRFIRFDILEFYEEENAKKCRRTSFYVNLSAEKVMFITQGDYDHPYDEERDDEELHICFITRTMMMKEQKLGAYEPLPNTNAFIRDRISMKAFPSETPIMDSCGIMIILRLFEFYLFDVNYFKIGVYSRDIM